MRVLRSETTSCAASSCVDRAGEEKRGREQSGGGWGLLRLRRGEGQEFLPTLKPLHYSWSCFPSLCSPGERG